MSVIYRLPTFQRFSIITTMSIKHQDDKEYTAEASSGDIINRNSPIPLTKVKSLRPAAFFDFDKTILSTDSQGIEFEGLWNDSWAQGRYRLFCKLTWFALFWCKLYDWGWIDGVTINRAYISQIYRGMLLQDLEENGRKLYKSVLRQQLFTRMIEKMKNHHAMGHAVIVISATPFHLLQPFVEEYQDIVEAFLATKIEVDVAGRCLEGKVCIGTEKALAQHRFADALGLDLTTSFAYSDHHHDLQFLQQVKYPNVVNPTRQLKQIAKKMDWAILEVRIGE
jgi:HAD superfamily hydrolase (TIGR01490 family)